MVYRQRNTFLDDFLLRVICPWLVHLHAAPLLRLVPHWCEPVEVSRPVIADLTAGPWSNRPVWSFANSTAGTLAPAKPEQSSLP
jgi:hypothetical protein